MDKAHVVRPHLLNRLAVAILGAGLSIAFYKRGTDLGSSDLQIMSAVFALVTIVVLINIFWFHFTRFTETAIYQSRWFGLSTTVIELEQLRSVSLQQQAGLDWPFASVLFAWGDGEISLRLPIYGQGWIKPVTLKLQSQGVPIDEKLLLAIETGRYDPPLFNRSS